MRSCTWTPASCAPTSARFRRVLVPGGRAVIHHPNVDDPATHVQDEAPGWRAPMSGELFGALTQDAALRVVSQVTYWDAARHIGVPRFNDLVTVLERPR